MLLWETPAYAESKCKRCTNIIYLDRLVYISLILNLKSEYLFTRDYRTFSCLTKSSLYNEQGIEGGGEV